MNRIKKMKRLALLAILGLMIWSCSDMGEDPGPILDVVTSVNFGSVEVGDTTDTTIVLLNKGMETLLIDSVRITDDDLSEFSVTGISDSTEIQPDLMDTLLIQFVSTSDGSKSAILNIYSNDMKSLVTSVNLSGTGGEATTTVSFANDVQPIFSSNCTGCHGGSGGLTLTSFENLIAGTSNNGPVVTSGDGAGSIIIQKLRGTAGFGVQMPKDLLALSENLISTIETWINEGAQNN